MIKKFILEAIFGFILWTAFLTPYMVFVVGVSGSQYLAWLAMQGLLVPPLAVLVVNITNWGVKRLMRRDTSMRFD